MKAKDAIKKICPQWLLRLRRRIISDLMVLFFRAKSFLLSGRTEVYCPCCDIRFVTFVSGNYINHPDRFNPARYSGINQEVICPVCHSLPRHRILANWLDKHRFIFESASVLYFAPEDGMKMWMKRNKIMYNSADLFADVDLKIDIQSTGLSDEAYDVIICNHVLEHVDDFRMALREMHRILRKGGSFICSFPMDLRIDLLDEDSNVVTEEERIRRYGQNDHKRVFGKNADRFLVEAGFEVEIISGEDCPDEIMPIVGPADYDINRLFRCLKA